MLLRRALRLVDESLLDEYKGYMDYAGEFQTADILKVAPEYALLDVAAILGLPAVVAAYEAELAPAREAYSAAVQAANEIATNAINALVATLTEQRNSGQITAAEYRTQYRTQKSAIVGTKNDAIRTQEQTLRNVTATERAVVITAIEAELDRLNAL